MKISTKGRYALRVMIDLAQHDTGEYITLKDISERQEIPIKYLEQIVSALGKAGMLYSMRGSGGGHRLARPAAEFKAGEILRAMEGDLKPVDCSRKGPDPCPRYGSCPASCFWLGLEKTINDYIDHYTLQDLADQDSGDDYNYSI